MRGLALLAMLALSATPVQAGLAPIPSGDDSRIGILRNAANDVARVDVVIGNDLTLLMPRGELIETVELKDTQVWHVSVAPARDGLVLYALRPVSDSTMTVRTNRATYHFALNANVTGVFPYLVRLENGGTSNAAPQFKAWTPPVVVPPGSYRLSGAKAVLPSTIRDDGRKTYLQWDANQPLPALFALDARGHEAMIEGYMREGVFTIDHLVEQLVFRLDKAKGKARRIAPKRAK